MEQSFIDSKTFIALKKIQEWQFGLWMYCRRGGNHNEASIYLSIYLPIPLKQTIPPQVGSGGLDFRDWICDLRSTIPLANQGYRQQAAFVTADHNEIPGTV